MVGVASSTLVSRSIFLLLFLFSSAFSITIKEALSEQITAKYPGIQISNIDIIPPKNIPDDISSYALKGILLTSLGGSKGGAKVEFSKENSANVEINFKFEIEARIPVAIAAHDITRNKIIDGIDVILDFIDFAEYEKTMLSEIPTGKIARNNIKKGSRIRANHVTKPKDVQRGDTIFVESSDGGVNIQVQGVAVNSGNIGDTIEVRFGSGRQKAQIIDKNRAVIR